MKTDVTFYLTQSTLSSPPMSSFAPNHREGQCQQLGCGKPLRASSQSPSTQPPQRVSIVRPLAPAPGNTVGDSDQSWAHHLAHLPGCSYNHAPLPAFPDSEAEIPPRTFLPNQEASRRRALHSDVSQACKTGLSRRGARLLEWAGTATPLHVQIRQGPAEEAVAMHPELPNMLGKKHQA